MNMMLSVINRECSLSENFDKLDEMRFLVVFDSDDRSEFYFCDCYRTLKQLLKDHGALDEFDEISDEYRDSVKIMELDHFILEYMNLKDVS